MISPSTLLTEWVTVLQSCTDMVDALGGNADHIRALQEGLTVDNNLRLAILAMKPGSILVVWNGTGPYTIGGTWHFAHRFSLYLLAPEEGATYADLWSLLIGTVPPNQTLPLLHYEIDPGCFPIDMEKAPPSIQRNSVVVGADGATFDYFEAQVTLVEQGNPGGE